MFEAIDSAMEKDRCLEQVTSDFIAKTVESYSETVDMDRYDAEILETLVAELVYDEDWTEHLVELVEGRKRTEEF